MSDTIKIVTTQEEWDEFIETKKKELSEVWMRPIVFSNTTTVRTQEYRKRRDSNNIHSQIMKMAAATENKFVRKKNGV